MMTDLILFELCGLISAVLSSGMAAAQPLEDLDDLGW
jgi:hypothetical protein